MTKKSFKLWVWSEFKKVTSASPLKSIVVLFSVIMISFIMLNNASDSVENKKEEITKTKENTNAYNSKENGINAKSEIKAISEQHIQNGIINADDSPDIINKKKAILREHIKVFLRAALFNKIFENEEEEKKILNTYNNYVAAICDWTCSLDTKHEILDMFYNMVDKAIKNENEDDLLFKVSLWKPILEASQVIDAPYKAELLRKAQKEDPTVILLQKDNEFLYYISKMYSSGFFNAQNYVKVKIVNDSDDMNWSLSNIIVRFFDNEKLLDEGALKKELKMPPGKSETVLVAMNNMSKSTPEWYHKRATSIDVSIEGKGSNKEYSVSVEDTLEKN